jgi:hypothetical protein
MTIVLSVRNSEGVLIAADKLASAAHILPGMRHTVSKIILAENRTFACGLYGCIDHLLIEDPLRRCLRDAEKKGQYVATVAQAIARRLFESLSGHYQEWLEDDPKGDEEGRRGRWFVGLQVVGYQDGQPVTWHVRVSAKLRSSLGRTQVLAGSQCRRSPGPFGVSLLARDEGLPRDVSSIAEAVSYARERIEDEAQRCPDTVGEGVDIAVRRPDDLFGWWPTT